MGAGRLVDRVHSLFVGGGVYYPTKSSLKPNKTVQLTFTSLVGC